MVKMNYYNNSIKAEADNSSIMDKVYKKSWPTTISIEINKDKKTQALGIDKLVYIKEQKLPIRIEEKCRPDKWYGDIALEYMSNDTIMSPGWMEKQLLCDYLFYFVKPIEQVFWFNWPELKHLWDLNKQNWILWGEQEQNGFTKITAPNPSYNTLSVGVPPEILLYNIKTSGTIKEVN